eukprot:5536527-Alexandrium_andersonii.AAC.1
MSASLVGSEMCIRDSLESCPGRTLRVGLVALTRGTRQRSSDCSLGWAPVSYTHLTLPTICSV